MPINPKLREIMRRGESEKWTLRFWFNAKEEFLGNRREECSRIVRDIMVLIVTDQPSSVDSVEKIVRDVLDSFVDPGCAAYEITNADTGNGDVVYLEWP